MISWNPDYLSMLANVPWCMVRSANISVSARYSTMDEPEYPSTATGPDLLIALPDLIEIWYLTEQPSTSAVYFPGGSSHSIRKTPKGTKPEQQSGISSPGSRRAHTLQRWNSISMSLADVIQFAAKVSGVPGLDHAVSTGEFFGQITLVWFSWPCSESYICPSQRSQSIQGRSCLLFIILS